METLCGKCGASLRDGQAFCTKCGAVVGMSDARRAEDSSPNLAATIIGHKLPAMQTPRREAPPVSQSAERAPARAPRTPPVPLEPSARKGNTLLYIVLGFMAVFVIGGLLLFLLVAVVD